jgi:hypothetical protein
MTKREFIDDVILQVSQSNPSDDSEIEPDQIAFWGTYHLNDLVKKEIDIETSKARFIPPIYITMEDCLVSEVEASDCTAACKDRLFVTLTGEVMDLPDDGGIVRVMTDEGDTILKASIESLDYIKNLRFAKPSMTNPLYYRQALKIYIEGIKLAVSDLSKVTVYYVKKQDISTLTENERILVTDQVKPILINAVVQRLKLELYGSDVDQESDGVDYKKPAYHNVIADPSKIESNPQPQ